MVRTKIQLQAACSKVHVFTHCFWWLFMGSYPVNVEKREQREHYLLYLFFVSLISPSQLSCWLISVCVCARILVCFYIPRSFLAAHTRKLIMACLSLWREVRTANVCYKR